MIASLAIAIFATSLGCGLVLAAQSAAGTYRWHRFAPTLVVVECALIVEAAADAVGLARGHRPAELATHVAYLVVSLLVIPIAAVQSARDDGRWAGVLLAVALFVVAVLVLRLQTTWREHG